MQRENETNQEAEERIRKQFDDNGMSIKINTRTINRGVNCERANKP